MFTELEEERLSQWPLSPKEYWISEQVLLQIDVFLAQDYCNDVKMPLSFVYRAQSERVGYSWGLHHDVQSSQTDM